MPSIKPRPTILELAPLHPNDLVHAAQLKLGISQQAIQRHIKVLVKNGDLVKKGKTKNTSYHLPKTTSVTSSNETAPSKTWTLDLNKKSSEHDIWTKTLQPELKKLAPNIFDLYEFAATEMINNVIDHASAQKITIDYFDLGKKSKVEIRDNGIGVFRKLKEAMNLESYRDAALQLSKGKLTTDPARHSGEGIFFSSRMFDIFAVYANGIFYGRNNSEDEGDWFLGEESLGRGTIISMEISKKSSRKKLAVFNEYTTPDDYSFSKTHIAIELGLKEGDSYVSRSQAKRLLARAEQFSHIILDFRRVKGIGQGFADEVFRVFQNNHPNLKIDIANANAEINFMIAHVKREPLGK